MARAKDIPGLACSDSFREAAGKILWTRFDEMMSFESRAVTGTDADAVHDMRVASRRLRAALEIFQDVFAPKQYQALRRDVKRVADALGGVRDLDVLEERLREDRKNRPRSQQLVLTSMLEEMEAQRRLAIATLVDTLKSLESSSFGRRFLGTVARETS
jgi:CHAD domain-containing protein